MENEQKIYITGVLVGALFGLSLGKLLSFRIHNIAFCEGVQCGRVLEHCDKSIERNCKKKTKKES